MTHERLTSPHSLRGTLWTGHERDACGMGFVAHAQGEASREVVQLALDAVARLAHRGAVDADDAGGGAPATGDGAGVLTSIPWAVLADDVPAVAAAGPAGDVGVGMVFLPSDAARRARARGAVEAAAAECGVRVIGWREVPVDPEVLGRAARATRPHMSQIFLERPADRPRGEAFEVLLFELRRRFERTVRGTDAEAYVASLSARTIVHKGLLVAAQLPTFFTDLADARFTSAVAVFHQRYSTNTFPAWERAQPCRTLAHNGEINTLRGNVAWMRARDQFGWPGGDPGWLADSVDERGSDSAMLDNVAELLARGGRDLPLVLTMLVPPAWDHEQDVDLATRDLLRLHAAACEPWDGPAAVAFTDGSTVGACLDRNGLRPARWLRTSDGIIACSSEAGSVPIASERIVETGRLGPGQMLVVDTATGSVRCGDEQVQALAAVEPWGIAVAATQVDVHDSVEPGPSGLTGDQLADHAAFGYSREELTAVLRPMVELATSPIGSMGDDTPLAVLASTGRSFFGCARQAFAEVTNPPIDPLRERSSMSLSTLLGPSASMLAPLHEAPTSLRLPSPVVTDAGLHRVRAAADAAGLRVITLDTLASADQLDAAGLEAAVDALCASAAEAVRGGADILVLSDRGLDDGRSPIPVLLAASAVHQHLVRERIRTRTGLLVDTGEVRDAHGFAALVAHGVSAVCPWLALATARAFADGERRRVDVDGPTAEARMVTALEYGLRTAMSRMGISTHDGYCGSQIFELVGLDRELAERHFAGTLLRPGGMGWARIAREQRARHDHAVACRAAASGSEGGVQAPPLATPGFYKFKRGGEQHAYEPAMVQALRAAVTVDDVLGAGFEEGMTRYREYAQRVYSRPPVDPRDLLRIEPGRRAAIALDEVEPASSIVRRFSTGAMSHGSLSAESHEGLAQAMQLIGASSNSGEGGEAVERYGTSRSSAIKQVASGRFGVTPAYLRSARELQIKMAQGSKPGEGGHLPGHKVTEEIARIRHTEPGVSLISPPPHHDIYSIEDLAQLIHDLACVSPRARLAVKLVSQAGVGTIAAGVAKARASTILVSGSSGGTGASPLGSIKHAGMPWEWGIAETQQVLVANGLRGRVRLRVDGGLRTGRDVVVAALLGADEFSFGTSALVAQGCKMARTCHNDQCPVGIATQRAELRALFPGRAEHVAAYLLFVAEEVRSLLAAVGARTLDDVIGRVDLLQPCDDDAARARRESGADLDLTALLATADVPSSWPRRDHGEQNLVNGVADGLDARLASDLWPGVLAAAAGGPQARVSATISNVDRSVGARLSGDIAERIDASGLPDGSVQIDLDGSAGQSLGAFAIRGLRIAVTGEANDFVGKGLAGAEVVVRFPPTSPMAAAPHDHVLVGNACLYGATSGSAFVAGCAGERFAVRNSGADAVVDGAGDHLCEYMTGGTVVALGAVGRNVASGMSGGTLWVWDTDGRLGARLAATAEVVEPSADELDRVRALVHRHADATGSPRALELLQDWPSASAQLRCVVPVERAARLVAAAGVSER